MQKGLNATDEITLSSETPIFIAQHSHLWPQHRRLAATTLALDCLLIIASGFRLFRTTQKQHWKSKYGGLRKTDAARSKSWLWAVERLFVVDILFSVVKQLVTLWIGYRKVEPPTWSQRLYLGLASMDRLVLYLVQTWILFLLAEFDVLFWGPPTARRVGTGIWYVLPRICHASGWLMAFGIIGMQLAISITKLFGASGLPWSEHLSTFGLGGDIVTNSQIKIILFFIGFLLFAPYYVVGGPWMWANLLITTATWTWRLARVTEKRGDDEATQLVVSLIVDFFYSRLPTLHSLIMFSGILSQRR